MTRRGLQAVVVENVQRLKRQQELSQAELAHRTGLRPDYVSRLIRGQRNFSLDLVVRFAAALKVGAAWLLVDHSRPELPYDRRIGGQRRSGQDRRSGRDRRKPVYPDEEDG